MLDNPQTQNSSDTHVKFNNIHKAHNVTYPAHIKRTRDYNGPELRLADQHHTRLLSSQSLLLAITNMWAVALYGLIAARQDAAAWIPQHHHGAQQRRDNVRSVHASLTFPVTCRCTYKSLIT